MLDKQLRLRGLHLQTLSTQTHMCACTFTPTHSAHRYTCVHTPAPRTQTHMRTCTFTSTHSAHKHTYVHTHLHPHTQHRGHTCMHTHSHTHTQDTDTRVCTHIHTHTKDTRQIIQTTKGQLQNVDEIDHASEKHRLMQPSNIRQVIEYPPICKKLNS